MSALKHRAFAAALGFVFFLTSCGDLGMVLPSQGSYRVNAQVDGDYTLDVYSVVTKNSRIRPYFVNSVVNDPDVQGLTVFVQDYSGLIVSRKVQYMLTEEAREALKAAAKTEFPEPTPQETPAPVRETAPRDVPNEVSREDPKEEDAQDFAEEAPADSFDEPLAAGEDEAPGGAAEGSGAPGGADTPYSAGEAENTDADGMAAADNDAADRDSADSNSVGTDAVNTDAEAEDSTDTDIEDRDSVGTDTAGIVTAGNDKNTAAADTADMPAAGKDKNAAAGDAADLAATGKDQAAAEAEDTAATGKNKGASEADTADRSAEGKDQGSSGTGNAAAGKDKNTAAAGAAVTGNDNKTAGTDAAGTAAAGKGTSAAGADTALAGNDKNAADATGKGTNTEGIDAADKNGTGNAAAGSDTAPPPAPPAENPIFAIPEDEIVQVKTLDQYLPAFRIVEALAIGRYNLVFQVMGEKEILYRTFKPIYFIGDAHFTLGEIQSFLPVAITGGRLVPPGINVMLGTEISADPRLDPYIIWHSGKTILAQGRLSEGADYFLWKTPEQTGFHSIRAEVFPLLPGDRMPGNMIGKIKELSLPVSAKSEGMRYFSDSAGEFVGWYELWGTLEDAKAPNNPARNLLSLNSQVPRWAPFGGMYGLIIGRDDGYTLPWMPFKLSGDAEGTGRILFRVALLGDGAIVSIRFAGGEAPAEAPMKGPMGTAELDLSSTGEGLILRIASESVSQEQSLTLNSDEINGFITLIVSFTIARDHFDAELRLEDMGGTTGPLSIALSAPVSGEGSLRLGGAEYPGHRRSVKRSASAEAEKYGGTMVLNELALSYARVPFLQQEDEDESALPENLIAEEDIPGADPESPSPKDL
jgi:hypothetical protein